MTANLHDVLDDLATTAAPHVIAPDLAAASWRAGRRRRRRRLITALTAALVLAAVAGTLTQAGAERWNLAGRGEQSVTGYPQRIGHQWPIGDLPDRPGPLAGLLQVRTGDSWQWHAFSATGYRWRLPAAYLGTDDHPTISRNGRYLGYLAGQWGPFVIHDLVTGKRVEFADVGSNSVSQSPKYMVFAQNPGYWSPDSRWLVRSGALRLETPAIATRPLLLGVDGTLRELTPIDDGHPAGWVDAEHPAWYQRISEKSHRPRLSVSTLDGARVASDLELHEGSPWRGEVFGQWAVTLSPDGTRLAVTEAGFPDPALRLFAMADRREVGRAVVTTGRQEVCTMSWAGNDPVVVGFQPDDAGDLQAFRVEGQALKPIVRIEPEAQCVVLAQTALAGKSHGLIPASWSWPVLWWWQEILAAIFVLAAAGWIRRRRRLSGTARSQTLSDKDSAFRP